MFFCNFVFTMYTFLEIQAWEAALANRALLEPPLLVSFIARAVNG